DGGSTALDIVAECENEPVIVRRAAAPAFDSRCARKGQRNIEIASRIVRLSRNSGGQLERRHWQLKGVNSVVGCEINPCASGDSSVPFAIGCHPFVRAATAVNKCAGVGIVAIQSLRRTAGGDGPN